LDRLSLIDGCIVVGSSANVSSDVWVGFSTAAVRCVPLRVHGCDVALMVDVCRVAQDQSELCGFNQI